MGHIRKGDAALIVRFLPVLAPMNIGNPVRCMKISTM
jgi:hypothetical protein